MQIFARFRSIWIVSLFLGFFLMDCSTQSSLEKGGVVESGVGLESVKTEKPPVGQERKDGGESVMTDSSTFDVIPDVTPGSPYWVRRAGSKGEELVRGVAVDKQGNTVITGSFSETADFGSTILTAKGSKNIFVAKLDSSGRWLWAKRAGSEGSEGLEIAVHSQNFLLITGFFYGNSDFGHLTLQSKGKRDLFIGMMDSGGKWLWVKRAGGASGEEIGSAVNITHQNNILVTGSFTGKSDFGTTILTPRGKMDIFVAKLNSQGKWLWVKQAKVTSKEGVGVDVVSDGEGNAIITGHFRGIVDFGGTTFTSSGTYLDLFVAKLSRNGKWLWARHPKIHPVVCWRIAIGKGGDSVVTGYFSGSAAFGTFKIHSYTKNEDAFIAKLDSKGSWVWAKSLGGFASDSGNGVGIDSKGEVVFVGTFGGPVRFGEKDVGAERKDHTSVVKFDEKGKLLWVRSAFAENYVDGINLAIDNSDNIVVVGSFEAKSSFGSVQLQSKGKGDLYIWKMPPNPPKSP